MNGEKFSFDELSRGMAEGTISRGKAMKLAGGALLGAALLPFASSEAQAKKKRKKVCKNPFNCETGQFSNCQGDENCVCLKTAKGAKKKNFCLDALTEDLPATCEEIPSCSEQKDCPNGTICVVDTCCPGGVCIPNSTKCPKVREAGARTARRSALIGR
ncbi:MAG: hypothetical protein ACRDSJ_02365 [Rubrobacteraceae bacterium]